MLTANDPEHDPCAPCSSATVGTLDASAIRNTTPSPRLPAAPPSLLNPQAAGRTYHGNPCAPGSFATDGTRMPIPVYSSDMDKRAPTHRTSPITTLARVTRSPTRPTAPHSSLAMTRTTSKNPLRSKTHWRGLKESKRQPPPPLTIIASFAPTSPAPRPARAQPRPSSTSCAPASVRLILPTPLSTPLAGNDLRRSILPPHDRHSRPLRPAPTYTAPRQRPPMPPPPSRPPATTAPDGSPKLSRAQSRKRRRILGQLTFVLLPACPTAPAPSPTSVGNN